MRGVVWNRAFCPLQRRFLATKSKPSPAHHSYEYSVTPHTFTYRLPSSRYPYDSIMSPTSPFSPLFNSLSSHPLNGSSPSEFFDTYPLITSRRLAKRTERPTKVKMLTSDFIEDSLYNPNYGYFPTQAQIFQTDSPFLYEDLEGTDDFMSAWLTQYFKYSADQMALQLWHTPTELFQPYYGEAIARYLLVNYKLNLYPYNDLIIYEIGGGNGTLMKNILDYIRENDPDVYTRTQYKIVEISKSLADKQRMKALMVNMRDRGHDGKRVSVINKSIMDWDEVVPEPCFVVGMEVLDNLSHDVVKYDIETGECHQGYVVIDEKGDFHQFFSPEIDEWTRLYLDLRGEHFITKGDSKWRGVVSGLSTKGKPTSIHPLNELKAVQRLRNWLSPFHNSLSVSEFIPTRLLQLFSTLNQYFPEHQLILADFDSFNGQSEGYNSPVVQTMIDGKMVAASTYMVQQGYFDIMFPTDFHIARDLYIQTCGKLIETSKHDEFLRQWGDITSTTTKSGENPLLDFYPNAAFLHS